MTDATEGFQQRLIEAFKASGLTQEQLGTKVQAAAGTVNGWVKHGAMPGGRHLIQLPEALGVPAGWLLTGEEADEPTEGNRGDVYAKLAEILGDRATTLLEKRAAMLDLALVFRAEAMSVQEKAAAREMAELAAERRAATPPADAAVRVDAAATATGEGRSD